MKKLLALLAVAALAAGLVYALRSSVGAPTEELDDEPDADAAPQQA